MADLTRRAPTPVPEAALPADRDAKTEALLLSGLDDYFAGRYERAIHAFTRVLFLDRTHPRARAYIERARAALAERQRETDELLHGGLEAFDRGETERARDLLTTAVTRGAPPELAVPVLERLDRLESGRADLEPGVDPRRPPLSTAVAGTHPRLSRSTRVMLGATALLLVVAGVVALGVSRFDTSGEAGGAAQAATPGVQPVRPWPMVRPSELALRRARLLFDRGNLHDARRALDPIAPDDALRGQADQLLADIQRTLLSGGPIDAGASRP